MRKSVVAVICISVIVFLFSIPSFAASSPSTPSVPVVSKTTFFGNGLTSAQTVGPSGGVYGGIFCSEAFDFFKGCTKQFVLQSGEVGDRYNVGVEYTVDLDFSETDIPYCIFYCAVNYASDPNFGDEIWYENEGFYNGGLYTNKAFAYYYSIVDEIPLQDEYTFWYPDSAFVVHSYTIDASDMPSSQKWVKVEIRTSSQTDVEYIFHIHFAESLHESFLGGSYTSFSELVSDLLSYDDYRVHDVIENYVNPIFNIVWINRLYGITILFALVGIFLNWVRSI